MRDNERAPGKEPSVPASRAPTEEELCALFEDCLCALALEPEAQAQLYPREACADWELLADYDSWRAYRMSRHPLAAEQAIREADDALQEAVHDLAAAAPSPELPCRETLQQPSWQLVRERAQVMLRLLGIPIRPPNSWVYCHMVTGTEPRGSETL